MQKAVTWPTEVASGYLSVIPGQFCVFRWSAVSAPSSDAGGERPLDTYLRGLNAIAPLERVMFLAEDRVFGNEIVLAHDKSWRIGYCPDCGGDNRRLRNVRGIAPSATAVAEQRARCPPVAMGASARLSGSSDKSVLDKARFTTSMLWQGLLTASEVMSPAFLAAADWRGKRSHPSGKRPCAARRRHASRGWRARLAYVYEPRFTMAVDPVPGAGRGGDAVCRFLLGTRPIFESSPAGCVADCALCSRGPDHRGRDARTALGSLAPFAALPSDGPPDQLRPLCLCGRQRAQREVGNKGPDGQFRGSQAEKQRMRRLRNAIAGAIVAIQAG